MEWVLLGLLAFIAWTGSRVAGDARASRKLLERLLTQHALEAAAELERRPRQSERPYTP